MKLLVWLLLVAVVATLIPLTVGAGNGYVLLVQAPYRIELSTSMFLLLVLLTFLLVYGLLRLVFYTMNLPHNVQVFKQERRQKQANSALMESIKALAEGRFGQAGKCAETALELGAEPLIPTLIAARSAHKLKNFERRDFYLAECERLAPDDDMARLLSQSELLLDQRRFSEALNSIRQLEKSDAKHLSALLLELKVQRHLGNWGQVLELIEQLEKRHAIESVLATLWKRQAYLAQLARNEDNLESLGKQWQKTPDDDQLDTYLALAAAKHFLHAGAALQAAEIVEKSLTKQWDSALAECYGECVDKDAARQLQQAESWLTNHHNDAGLLLSLGKLCMHQSLWGKAQSYLEASISVKDSAAAHWALAQMMEQLEKPEQANQHYRLSLKLKMAESS
jgi:HemY protein